MVRFLLPCTLQTRLLNKFRNTIGIRIGSGIGSGSEVFSRSICTAQSYDVKKEDVVIVGAGIAGLATAISLRRLGVRSVVLEQAESLRTGGTSVTLSTNAWRVLDAMGVGNELRNQFLAIQGVQIKSEDGRELRSFNFKDEFISQEIRAVERKILLETLANQLPLDAISFSSKLANIERRGGETLLELVNGKQLSAKIVIACDGIHSPVAKWMGFSEPKFSGHCAFRGLGYYPEGQPYETMVNYIYGRGMRAAYVPISPTKVYWFIITNNSSPGPRITDPSVLKKQTRDLVKSWHSDLPNIINVTPDDAIIKNPIVDRWPWPGVSPAPSSNGVVLVGDAWHPMTPNLGQGACIALEDAIVLAKKLAPVIKSGSTSVEDVLRSYHKERWPRIFSLTVRSNLTGAFLQLENPLVCYVRNNILIPKVKLESMFEHANFDCGPLQ